VLYSSLCLVSEVQPHTPIPCSVEYIYLYTYIYQWNCEDNQKGADLFSEVQNMELSPCYVMQLDTYYMLTIFIGTTTMNTFLKCWN